MTDELARSVAREPEDLGRLLMERAASGDVDGMAALFEPDAVAGFPGEDPPAGAMPSTDCSCH